jgi:phosphotransferase system  glucose/maltose/N-acetylglucosamine-specific IIC component
MHVRLFITACLLGGLGGVVGSVLGAGVGRRGLFVGGFLGGILIAPLTARMALWRGWIRPTQVWGTAVGAAAGFAAAATVAVNTLSSPVGPVVSTMLIGVGALVGRGAVRDR